IFPTGVSHERESNSASPGSVAQRANRYTTAPTRVNTHTRTRTSNSTQQNAATARSSSSSGSSSGSSSTQQSPRPPQRSPRAGTNDAMRGTARATPSLPRCGGVGQPRPSAPKPRLPPPPQLFTPPSSTPLPPPPFTRQMPAPRVRAEHRDTPSSLCVLSDLKGRENSPKAPPTTTTISPRSTQPRMSTWCGVSSSSRALSTPHNLSPPAPPRPAPPAAPSAHLAFVRLSCSPSRVTRSARPRTTPGSIRVDGSGTLSG
ncbi:unnamed protein product, partial [Lampetra planeri]